MQNEETMSKADPIGKNSDPVKDTTDMAAERTIMAADRSLMAWVRTGLALIGFGFTIYKFLVYQQEQIQAAGKEIISFSNPKVLGMVMIGLGILTLIFGMLENMAITKNYRVRYDIRRPRYSLIIAGIITAIGILLLTAIIFKI
jgi:putative membrane protein